MAGRVDDFEFGEYSWQMAWSHLLNLGVIINPPVAAKCLMHTTFDKIDRFNKVINQTPHAKGTAFNVGGGGNGVTDEAAVIQKALNNKVPGLVGYLIERENNALHVSTKKI